MCPLQPILDDRLGAHGSIERRLVWWVTPEGGAPRPGRMIPAQ